MSRRSTNRSRLPSLLGSYPRRLHLVGASDGHDVLSPMAWTAEESFSYGIDYTFTRTLDRQPVRWRADRPIVVRLVRGCPDDTAEVLQSVVSEVRQLTGLALVVGDLLPDAADPWSPAPGEIRVAHRRLTDRDGPGSSCRPDALGVGGALGVPQYHGGFAVIDPERSSGPAAASIGVLRHELGHALGLGHANRATCLMYTRATVTTWSAADRVALRLAGPAGDL